MIEPMFWILVILFVLMFISWITSLFFIKRTLMPMLITTIGMLVLSLVMQITRIFV